MHIHPARRYFNDTWAFDLEALRWEAVAAAPGHARPGARGGCQLAVHRDRLLLYGGHTVVTDPQDRSEREVVHDDLWALDLGTFQVRRRLCYDVCHRWMDFADSTAGLFCCL